MRTVLLVKSPILVAAEAVQTLAQKAAANTHPKVPRRSVAISIISTRSFGRSNPQPHTVGGNVVVLDLYRGNVGLDLIAKTKTFFSHKEAKNGAKAEERRDEVLVSRLHLVFLYG